MTEFEKILRLGNRQIINLRRDIVLNSEFTSDYENRYGIDAEAVYDFFNGYMDYLGNLMEEDGNSPEDFDYMDELCKYDNADNLRAWRDCFER